MKTYKYLCMVRKGKEATKRYFILETSFNKDCGPNKSLQYSSTSVFQCHLANAQGNLYHYTGNFSPQLSFH